MKKTLALILCTGMLFAAPAFAEEAAPEAAPAAAAETPVITAPSTVTTQDGVLSIQLPGDNWKIVEDAKYWFVITNGTDIITIDHLSNGESLPAPAVADGEYGSVFQAYLSNDNEVFVVKGSAKNRDSIANIIQAIGTIRILQFDTKTAIKKQATGDAAQSSASSGFTIEPKDQLYYVVVDSLNVRSGYSSDDSVIGTLSWGEGIQVTGVVKKDGADYGWLQVSYYSMTGYISSSFVSPTSPYPDDPENPSGQELAYCEYCGQWYEAGNVFRNHICPERDAAYAREAAGGDAHEGMAYCEYCGQWYHEGNEFRNHICPARDAANGVDTDDDDWYDYDNDPDDYEDYGQGGED